MGGESDACEAEVIILSGVDGDARYDDEGLEAGASKHDTSTGELASCCTKLITSSNSGVLGPCNCASTIAVSFGGELGMLGDFPDLERIERPLTLPDLSKRVVLESENYGIPRVTWISELRNLTL